MSRSARMLEAAEAAAANAADVADGQTVALVDALDALRLTITAVLADDEPQEVGWMRLELFGHTVQYGHIRETLVAGKRFLQLTHPAVTLETEHDRPAKTR